MKVFSYILLVILFMVLAAPSHAENIIISAEEQYRVPIGALLGKYRYSVVSTHEKTITIQVPEADTNYTGFILELFGIVPDVRIMRGSSNGTSSVRVRMQNEIALENARAVIDRLESLGAHVAAIRESSDNSVIEITVPAENEERMRMEIILLTNSVPEAMLDASSTLNKSSCELFFR